LIRPRVNKGWCFIPQGGLRKKHSILIQHLLE
jgi:hypothetical protein